MSTFEYTDDDGDRAAAYEAFDGHPQGYVAVLETGDPMSDTFACVGLTTDAARDLAAKLTEWAGEPEPERMPAAFAVGDRVQVIYGHGWNGLGVVETVSDRDSYYIYIVRVQTSDFGEAVGGFSVQDLRLAPAPDYPALAATFKPGDLAIVGDNPGTGAEPGSGYVAASYAGKAVVVEGPGYDAALVSVRQGDQLPQRIHVAHLTRAKVVPA